MSKYENHRKNLLLCFAYINILYVCIHKYVHKIIGGGFNVVEKQPNNTHTERRALARTHACMHANVQTQTHALRY